MKRKGTVAIFPVSAPSRIIVTVWDAATCPSGEVRPKSTTSIIISDNGARRTKIQGVVEGKSQRCQMN